MFNEFRSDVNSTLKTLVQLVYYMRGSISYNDMLNMTFSEREIVNDFITERLEQESKRMHPVY
jgi:hypothetical protein